MTAPPRRPPHRPGAPLAPLLLAACLGLALPGAPAAAQAPPAPRDPRAATRPAARPPAAAPAARPSTAAPAARAQAAPSAARPQAARPPASRAGQGAAQRGAQGTARPPAAGRAASPPAARPAPPPRPAAPPPAAALPAAGLAGAGIAGAGIAALPPGAARLPAATPFLPAPVPVSPGPAAAPSAAPSAACGERPAPQRNVTGAGYFLDPAFSRPDPARLAADTAAAKPLRDWLAAVQSHLARHRRGEPGAAACALELLDHWARNDALLGAVNLEGGYHRVAALAGAALTFLALREPPAAAPGGEAGAAPAPVAGLEPARLARVARWLAAVAREVRPRYDRRSEALISDVRDGRAAWAGLAAAAAGTAAGDAALLSWGMDRLRAQLAQVDARGALPQALRRGQLALREHLSALAAVAALERLARANAVALTEAETAALRRLRDLAFAAAQEPARMEALAGAPQADPWAPDVPPLARAPGLELSLLALPDPAVDAALAPFRPYADPFLGGEVSGRWKP